MTSQRTSIKLIERAVSENWIRQLAFYHLLKLRYNNGCIYRYKSRMDEIAEDLHISTKTLYNYLNQLKSKGLICDHANNLKLKSIKDFRTKRKKSAIRFYVDHTLFDITCLLYSKLIERKARQQAFAESVRRFGRGDRFKSGLSENPFQPSLSYRNIAKLLNISESKAFRVIDNLNRLQVVRTTKQKPRLLSNNFSELSCIEDMPGYRFNIGNRLFEVFGIRFEFLHYPIYIKKITIRQYKKFINRDL